MRTTRLADVCRQLGRYVEEVATTHERVTITRNGKPAAVTRRSTRDVLRRQHPARQMAIAARTPSLEPTPPVPRSVTRPDAMT